MWKLVLLVSPWGSFSHLNSTGLLTCPCVEWANLGQYRVGNAIRYIPKGQDTGYDYPLNYGNLECKAHDSGLPPFCNIESPPAWCVQKWCYVDKTDCSIVPYRSFMFEGSDAHYSYQTCGESNQFETWTASLGRTVSVTELLDVVQGYLWSTRKRVESEHMARKRNVSGCNWINQCPCAECVMNDLWRGKTDFTKVGVTLKSEDSSFACLSLPVSQNYIHIAAKEGQPYERVGYMYFADHASGSYMGWPAVNWCFDSGYDPRLRPWYSSGATSPKDLVIVVDVSDSLQRSRRSLLAQAATSAVIDTLEWKDWATVILFNHGIEAQYSQQLLPMSGEERSKMKNWLNHQIWNQGGTDFQTALWEAFAVIERSVSAGSTSMCQRGILFLTYGEADFTEYDFAETQRKALQFSVAIFTYALGSGGDTSITHRMACENRGIFYQLPDNAEYADLSTAMSKYYEYFASGVELCLPSFTRYQDVVTGAELWPACLPNYDRSSGEQELLGVGCIDLNVMADLEKMKSESYWEDFVCKLSDLSKQCHHLDLSECRLEKLRRAVGPESSCADMTLESSCACADPNCQDNANFLDELGYFCDTWVGDDCTRAIEDWGYTAAGQESVLQQCRRSCGRCPQGPCQDGQCQKVENISSTACREKLTTRVTPNKIENQRSSKTTSLPTSEAGETPTSQAVRAVFSAPLAWINPWAWLYIFLAHGVCWSKPAKAGGTLGG
eukprot:s4354_g6.t1